MYSFRDHTYAICAYGDSPYLEDCVSSLLGQSLKSEVLLVTSTPSNFISGICDKYQIPCYVNPGPGGISGDWNYAVSCATTNLVTIAHQDDVYLPAYTEEMLSLINQFNTLTLYFSDYGELRYQGRVDSNRLLNIKRTLLRPLRNKVLASSRFVRRRCLSLGNPICCPSATLIKTQFREPLFQSNFSCNLDWEAWETLANLKGSFVYNQKVLMLHRIHEESETSHLIEDGRRSAEDLEMLSHFWPVPIARLINRVYGSSQTSNSL